MGEEMSVDVLTTGARDYGEHGEALSTGASKGDGIGKVDALGCASLAARGGACWWDHTSVV